ncbi:mechanosensitive ion channel family protein [Actinoplanes sp. URMC 104]|uniref:mechanosensitive ion channel family protein n=1 Tax=Actinoplanes sp. URMC 104 TaxID=3423409 RepID=UPI003F1D6D75
MTGDGLSRGLGDMWHAVVMVVPVAVAFAAILLIGYLVARAARAAATRGLHKAGLDRAVERGAVAGLFRAEPPSMLAGRLAFFAVLLLALHLAFGVWGPNPVSALLTALIAWLPRLLVAIVLVLVAATVARAVRDLVAGALGALPYGPLLARAASVVIVTLGVVAALDQVRIATAVTQPLLIAVLATVGGVVVVGAGGGLIKPMQQRWDTWLDRATTGSTAIRDHVRAGRPAEEHRRYADPGEADETQVIPRQADPGPAASPGDADDSERTQVIADGDPAVTRPLPTGEDPGPQP